MRGQVGRPRRRPQRVTADRGYDHDKYRRELRRRELRRRGIAPEIARRQAQHGSGLGRARWVVERTFAWLHHFKRLLVRYDRRHKIHEAFLAIGCCLVCFPDSATHCDSSSNSAIVDAAVLAVERPLPSRSPRRWPATWRVGGPRSHGCSRKIRPGSMRPPGRFTSREGHRR